MRSHWRALIAICAVVQFAGSASAQGKKGAPPAAAPAPAAATAPSSSGAFESQMLAFGGLDLIAGNIAGTICDKANQSSTIVIYDQTAFGSLQAYEAFIANIQILYGSYKNLIPPITNPTDDDKTYGLGASNTIDPFADATSLLSAIAIATNTESPGSITIPDSSMAIALTKHLGAACKEKVLTIVYPPLFGSGSSSDYSSADLQSEIKKLDYVRKRAQATVDELNVQFMGKYPSATSGNPVLNSVLTDIDGLYDSFMNSLLQVNSTSGAPGSAAVIQGFQLANLMRGPKVTTLGAAGNSTITYPKPAYVLLASITNAGGTVHTHKNIWTALWSGDKITYSGGLVVNVALWSSNGSQPIYANVLRYRAPFTKIAVPANVTDVEAGDNLNK